MPEGAFIQGDQDNQASASVMSFIMPANVTAGSILVAHFGWGNTRTFTSIVDTLGNTWTQIGAEVPEGSSRYRTYWAYSPSGGADTITVTISGNAAYRGCAGEFGPLEGSGQPDGTATILDQTGTAIDSGTGPTRTNTADLLIGLWAGETSVVTYSSPAFGGTAGTVHLPNGNRSNLWSLHVSDTTTRDATITLSASSAGACAMIAFKDIAAAAGLPPGIEQSRMLMRNYRPPRLDVEHLNLLTNTLNGPLLAAPRPAEAEREPLPPLWRIRPYEDQQPRALHMTALQTRFPGTPSDVAPPPRLRVRRDEEVPTLGLLIEALQTRFPGTPSEVSPPDRLRVRRDEEVAALGLAIAAAVAPWAASEARPLPLRLVWRPEEVVAHGPLIEALQTRFPGVPSEVAPPDRVRAQHLDDPWPMGVYVTPPPPETPPPFLGSFVDARKFLKLRLVDGGANMALLSGQPQPLIGFIEGLAPGKIDLINRRSEDLGNMALLTTRPSLGDEAQAPRRRSFIPQMGEFANLQTIDTRPLPTADEVVRELVRPLRTVEVFGLRALVIPPPERPPFTPSEVRPPPKRLVRYPQEDVNFLVLTVVGVFDLAGHAVLLLYAADSATFLVLTDSGELHIVGTADATLEVGVNP